MNPTENKDLTSFNTDPEMKAVVADVENGGEILDAISKHYAGTGQNINQPAAAAGPNVVVDVTIEKVNESNSNLKKKPSCEDSCGREDNNIVETVLPQSQAAVYCFETPGAYAVAPQGGTTEATEASDETAHQEDNVVTVGIPVLSSEEEDHQAVAVAVEEGQLETERNNLPQAEPFDEAQRAQNDTEQRRKAIRRSLLFLACGVLLIAGVVLLLVLLLKPQDDQDTTTNSNLSAGNSTSDLPTPSPSLAPTSIWEGQVVSHFPATTSIALENTTSPQSKAFQWLLDDPFLSGYANVDWRVRQRFILATFYYATEGTNWTKNDNWLSYDHHECSWYGRDHYYFIAQPGMRYPPVEHPNACQRPDASLSQNDDANQLEERHNDPSFSAYKHLWLLKNNMKGIIPDELFWLTTLRSIAFGGNLFEGTLPTLIGQLSGLEFLSVSRNSFTGTIPTEFNKLPSFTSLFLSRNGLTGTIPTQLGLMPKLETAMFDNNQFTGTIPSELVGVSALYMLYLAENLLTGSLPTEIGHLTGITDFLMYSNNLSGFVPTEIGLLQVLERFTIRGNSFSGTLCTELGLLTAALSLELQDNHFLGPIPSELGSLQNVTHLMLQDNQLTSTVPKEILAQKDSVGSSSWRSFNFTGNMLDDVHSQEDLCWMNSTWNQADCPSYNIFVLPTMCQCNCACSPTKAMP